MTQPKTAAMPEAQGVRLQLQRILASAEFANAVRMCRFLEMVVTEALAGRAATLKEYSIGVAVFDRPASFDPGTDPIVRVEARRLRAKLEKYYAGEGRGDRLLIELPKGRYAPAFRNRSPVPDVEPYARANTIAVLPFQNLSPSPDGQYFSDGLTWELIHQLTRVDGLAVVAWDSAEQVRESADAMSAGARLKAGTVLRGSVRQAGDRLRIIAQLIEASTGRYLWSETYDRRLEEIFAIQDDIACAIVSRLRTRLSAAGPVVRLASSYNLEAYQLYLRGRAHWNRRTEQGLLFSIECFRRASEIDPRFALAYAGLADAHALLADYGFAFPADAVPVAKRAARRALEIDPSLGEAHCSLALLLALYDWDWVEAENHLRKALALNPGYATAHHWLGVDLLVPLGRFDEALAEIEMARQLDPLSLIICEGRAFVLMVARRYEDAAEHLRAMIESHPTFYRAHTSFGRTLLEMGRYDEAIRELEEGCRMVGRDVKILGALGQAYAMRGDAAEARRILAELEAMASTRHVPSSCFAIIHIGLGEKAQALERLRCGVDQHELPMAMLAAHPAYDALRGEREFQELLKRIGLASSKAGI